MKPICNEDDTACTIEQLQAQYTYLQQNQEEIKQALHVNTEITKEIKEIIDSVKGFFNFCAKAGKFGVRIAKVGTVLSVALVSVYHAIDAIASHNINDLFKWGKK